MGQGLGAVTELIEFEHTDRTVPQDGLRGLEHLGELLGSLRADVENHVVFGHVLDRLDGGFGILGDCLLYTSRCV